MNAVCTYNSLDEQLIVEFHGPLQIKFEQLNYFQLKFHLSFFREVVGFVVFQYVHVPEQKKTSIRIFRNCYQVLR